MPLFLTAFLIPFIGAYLIGSVPFGLIAGKMVKGVDVRDYGSGNIGATNVMRVLGPVWGSIVFVLDVLKGFIPTFFVALLLKKYGLDKEFAGWITVFIGIMTVLGHSFSCFLKFKGGKGVATSLGVIVGLDWRVAIIGYVIYLIVLAIWRYVSLGSVIATLSVPVMFICFRYFDAPLSYKILSGILFVAIFLKHIPNIKRLINHTEAKFGEKKTDTELKK
ncbi:MAG: glycerol-3-phosphate 1-O-acyltransferase PlsY [Armatimonadetes bacterium]|nr:glycerol-3-phosphate 1-O-acyltransferase PlsY [Candidatus Hippobium faecium]